MPDSNTPNSNGNSFWNAALPGFNGPTDIPVFVNPTTKQAATTDDPAQIAALLASGFERHTVAGSDWSTFTNAFGSNFQALTPQTDLSQFQPTQAPLSQAQQDALNGQFSDNNGSAAAAEQNLLKAYNISQPARDRAVTTTNEDYAMQVQPTLASAAFSGAGYNQGLHSLFGQQVSRDRTLAGLADTQTAQNFELQTSQQSVEQQRLQAQQQAYSDALAASQTTYNTGVNDVLAWLK